MSKKDLHTSISELIPTLTPTEFSNIESNFDYFSFKYPDFVKEFSKEIEKIKSAGKWNEFLREIKFWKSVGVEPMNRRLLQLCLRYKSKVKEFIKIDNEIGAFTLPTRIDRLNKLSLLARELIFDIFPRIEDHINFKTEVKKEQTKILRGKIDWNTTILNSASRGEKFPLSFTCVIESQNFETPENLLAMACLLKLKSDVDYLLYSKDVQHYELNFRELYMLRNLKGQIDNMLTHTQLKQIIPKIIEYSSLSIHSKMIKNFEDKTSERIRLRIVKQKSYDDLLTWLEKFKGYNIRTLTKNFTNFPIGHEKSIDTMYELWIIFEIVTFLVEKKKVQFIKILERDNGNFAGFQLKLNDTIFNLSYQSTKTGWSGHESNPDFTIEIEGTNRIPIIMDPKNYSVDNTGDAGHKMLGYLLNLSQYGAEVGILFFPRALGKHGVENRILPYVKKTSEINGKSFTYITMIANPNDPDMMESNFDVIYEHLKTVTSINHS